MKLNDIHVDGFGVWQDLHLGDVVPTITAFYGPNEAGKTTLLQFLRAMLYGTTTQQRRRYLPPVKIDKPGGTLSVESSAGSLRIARLFDRDSQLADALRITDAQGNVSSDIELAALLGCVDRATFNNVFAVGLQELQELGTLSDTEAASWLYSLTAGLDRVSLLDVMRNLKSTRDGLFAIDGSGGRIKQLAGERDRLQAQIDQLASGDKTWSRLHLRLDELDGELTTIQKQHDDTARQLRILEIAEKIHPRWQEREQIDQQLDQYSGRAVLPDDALQTLDDINGRIADHDKQIDILRGQRRALRGEAEELGINEVLIRNASRIEALGEQKDWLEALERQSVAIAAELTEIQSQLAQENQQLGVDLHAAKRNTPEIGEGMLNSLRPHAKSIRSCKERLMAAEREADSKMEAAEEFEVQFHSAMPAAAAGMPTDLDEAGELVASLRRRVQVEERLQQARRHEVELEEQNHDLLDRQELPLWMEASHTAMVVLGVALLAIGLMTGGTVAAWIGGIMLAVLIALRIFKYVGEEQIASRREALQRQLSLIQKQIHEATQELEVISGEMGPIEGAVVVKLQAAERHQQELQKLLPIDTQRRDARLAADTASRRVDEARRKLESVQSTWQSKLTSAGLPKDWTPNDLRKMAGRHEQISELRLRVARRREDAEQRQREHATLCKRISNLAEQVGLVLKDVDPLKQLEHLLSELRGHQIKLSQRGRLRKQAQQRKQQQQRHRRSAAALRQQHDAILHQAGVDNENAYRDLYRQQQHAAKLRQQRDTLSGQIAAAIGDVAAASEFARLFAHESPDSLAQRCSQTASSLREFASQIANFIEQRGAVGQQLKAMAQDRTLAENQFELGCIDAQLQEAIREWRVAAMMCLVLERIRSHYEQHRQPATLLKASEILSELTDGRYQRVWTPLGKDILFVDDQEGNSLAIELLSRGTREQLFLALRLALVALLGRRGVHLPLILDDVLVNFDVDRARRAAAVLKRFAADGHQVLVFTCHEHVLEMFRSLHVAARNLPDRFRSNEPVIVETPAIAEPPAPAPRVKQFEVPVAADEEDYELEDAVELKLDLFPEPPQVEFDEMVVDDQSYDVELEMEPPTIQVRSVVEPMVMSHPMDHPDVEIIDDDWIRIGPQVRRRDRLQRRDSAEVTSKEVEDEQFEEANRELHGLLAVEDDAESVDMEDVEVEYDAEEVDDAEYEESDEDEYEYEEGEGDDDEYEYEYDDGNADEDEEYELEAEDASDVDSEIDDDEDREAA